jgi:hypothetical protein
MIPFVPAVDSAGATATSVALAIELLTAIEPVAKIPGTRVADHWPDRSRAGFAQKTVVERVPDCVVDSPSAMTGR